MWRWIASLLISGHLLAILLATGAVEGGGFTSPPLIKKLAEPIGPWIRFLNLGSGYRFFAPDPGPVGIVWCRLEYEDGGVRWVELPSRHSHRLNLPRQRELNAAMALSSHVMPPQGTASSTNSPGITDMGLTLASSFSRHFVAVNARVGPSGKALNVQKIRLLIAFHAIRAPQQVRDGWTPSDPRLYLPVVIGEFDREGNLLSTPRETGTRSPPVFEVAADMLRDWGRPGSDPSNPDQPAILTGLLSAHPELSLDSDTPLSQRISDAVIGPSRKETP